MSRKDDVIAAVLSDEALKAKMAAKLAAFADVRGEDDCWLWRRALNGSGYGVVSVRKPVVVQTTRLAYALHYGTPPGALQVCHRCDTPACVNPAHLFLGTPAENLADMTAKGRRRPVKHGVGVRHHSAKLNPDIVRLIRASSAPHTHLARQYGVSHVAIRKVRLRQSWTFVA